VEGEVLLMADAGLAVVVAHTHLGQQNRLVGQRGRLRVIGPAAVLLLPGADGLRRADVDRQEVLVHAAGGGLGGHEAAR